MWALSWFLLIKCVGATSPMRTSTMRTSTMMTSPMVTPFTISSPRPPHHAEPLTHGSAIFIESWSENAFSQGGSLIVKIDVEDDICNQAIELIKISIINVKTFEKINNVNAFQKEKLSFSTFRMEQSIEILINLINKLIACENNMNDLIIIYNALKMELNSFWDNPEIKNNNFVRNLSSSRPNKRIQTANFPTALVGIGAGLLAGGVLGNLIGGKLDQWSLNNLNEKINQNNKNIIVTQESIEILEKNVTDIFQNIKKIFIELESDKEKDHVLDHMIFNIKNIEDTSNNYINLLKIRQNRLTMLRNGIISSEIINIDQFKKVIGEGQKSLKNLVFPITISKQTIPYIAKLMEIKEIITNKFIAIIPMVTKTKYKINSIIPLPIKISDTNFMKITIRNILLISNEEKIIISDDTNLEKIDENTFIMKKIEPIWTKDTKKCEIAAYKRDIKNVMSICSFEKLDSKDEIYMSEAKRERLMFAKNPEEITLNCPGGKIIKTFTGLYTIPFECEIHTKTFTWPARQSKEINIENLIDINDKLLDVKKLKIFEINDTKIINEKIKKLIDDLPEENEKLTIDFNNLNWNNTEPISLFKTGIIAVLLIINSIFIIIFCLKRKENNLEKKKWKKYWKNRWNENLELNKVKFRKAKDSMRDSFRDSYNKNKEKLRLKGQEFLREKVRDAETNTDLGDNQGTTNTHKKDVFVEVY